MITLATLVFGIIEGADLGWTDQLVLVAFAASLAFGIAFIWWERRCEHPMVRLELFRNPRFSAANLSVTFLFFALFGSTFFLTQYLQFVQGLSPLDAGVRLSPMAVAILVVSPLSARMAASIGTKLMVSGGLATVATGLLLTLRADTSTEYGPVLLALIVLGIGMGLTISPATDAIMGAVPPNSAGIGAAMNDTTRELGGALGVAVLGSVLSSHYRSAMDSSIGGALPAQAREVATDSVGGALVVAERAGAAGEPLAEAARSAFVDAMHTSVGVGAAVALCGAAVALRFLPARQRSEPEATDQSEPDVVEAA